MSAFIVTDTHINVLVTWAAANRITAYLGNPGKTWHVYKNEQDAAQLFHTMNVLSVNYRYKLGDPVGTISYKPTGLCLFRPIEIIKLCKSLEYQSCEYPPWGDSAAKQLLDEICRVAITKLPGYEEAPWSI
jgi:hypothetical protein